MTNPQPIPELWGVWIPNGGPGNKGGWAWHGYGDTDSPLAFTTKQAAGDHVTEAVAAEQLPPGCYAARLTPEPLSGLWGIRAASGEWLPFGDPDGAICAFRTQGEAEEAAKGVWDDYPGCYATRLTPEDNTSRLEAIIANLHAWFRRRGNETAWTELAQECRHYDGPCYCGCHTSETMGATPRRDKGEFT